MVRDDKLVDDHLRGQMGSLVAENWGRFNQFGLPQLY